MAVMTEELVPALEDVRQAHAAVLDRFRADATVTPPGPYRQMLERQAAEVQIGVQCVERRERVLHPLGVLGIAASVTRSVSHGVVRTAMLPVTVASKVVRGVLPGGGLANPRQQLRNAEDEYAAAARALAACRAGEALAEQVDDQRTADLLGFLRRQDEQLMEELEDSLAGHARAVAASANSFGPREGGNGGLGGAATQTIRHVFDRARNVAERGIGRARGADEGVGAGNARARPHGRGGPGSGQAGGGSAHSRVQATQHGPDREGCAHLPVWT
ncbi:hypothetical protein [Streptomyces dysideae]|uniref:Uncharacterized protein n=1 Tax=Streptomyces dysideae TaxID=909626 RepID=A0A117RU49_9ACTN|nr:hypothetical protein [Streptomyces dysideae]KUO09561.1 hypothetical protein AQJ91_48270 [Streptomyces dysideae]